MTRNYQISNKVVEEEDGLTSKPREEQRKEKEEQERLEKIALISRMDVKDIENLIEKQVTQEEFHESPYGRAEIQIRTIPNKYGP